MTENKTKGKRVNLSEEAERLISDATSHLKGKHCKVNTSNLASEVIVEFFGGKTEKFLKSMESKYFDQRRHLRTVLANCKDSESLNVELARLIEPGRMKKIKDAN